MMDEEKAMEIETTPPAPVPMEVESGQDKFGKLAGSKRSLERKDKRLSFGMGNKKMRADIGLQDTMTAVAEDGDDDLAIGGLDAWRRDPAPQVNPSDDDICIQQIDTDYECSVPITFPGCPSTHDGQRQAVIRMFGVNKAGNSVLMYIYGFLPYFYVPAWNNFTQADVGLFAEALNSALADRTRERGLARYVKRIDIERKQSIWGYTGGQTRNFIKVTVALPSLVATSRGLLKDGITIGHHGLMKFQSYESNIPYVLRYLIDHEIVGGGWITAKAGFYNMRRNKSSRCQIEIDVPFNAIVAHKTEGEHLDLAPMRILSFDIECAGRKGCFPEAKHDSVIQIANVVQIQGETKPIIKNVFTLNSCAAIAGAQVISNDDEKDLLKAWFEFFVTVDPDLVTGYNIINFDLPYLLDRAEALGIDTFPYLGRLRNARSTMKDSTFSSKAYGTRENKEIAIHGRVQFDLLPVVRREYKLRSYTLNSVCAHFLQQQKEDVHYSIISDLQNGTDETRRRLAVYCIKDALLPLRLLDKLMFVVNYVEMARVTGVPINYLITRGQQIKVVSQLLRKARTKNLLMPVRERHVTDDKYEGATVIEPKRGFYSDPISTLDFASLYPSIMMAHNLCYTTLIPRHEVKNMDEKDYVKTPCGDCFVRKEKHAGLLPEILNELLAARKQAKKDMRETKDAFKKAVLNGRQLALKISANSVYGFTGAQVGQLPCLAISSSVTAFGREMIDHTKKAVEEKYTIANGYAHDAEVIYGDTDSVMVKFGVDNVADAMKIGIEAAEYVSAQFLNPIKLEFEKVYYPYLLMNKKRYAGLYWTNEKKWDKMDTKGIETVRRDNCSLVKIVIETVLDKILIDKSVEGAVEYTKGMISQLLQNKVDLSLLVISKSLSKTDYANKMAHVELANRMRKRDPATAPVVGDRVPYVITRGTKGAPAYERAEDPIYVLEHDLPIDSNYYLTRQLQGPLERIFGPVMDNVGSLFAGEHTLKVKVSTPAAAAGGIMMFAVKKRSCIGCRVTLSPNEKVVCAYCKENQAALYCQQVDKIRKHERAYSRLWTQCQRCQGSLHQEVLCTSRDCPIFYRRKKVQKELRDAQARLDRFSF